jgi:hypothetical protein
MGPGTGSGPWGGNERDVGGGVGAADYAVSADSEPRMPAPIRGRQGMTQRAEQETIPTPDRGRGQDADQ